MSDIKKTANKVRSKLKSECWPVVGLCLEHSCPRLEILPGMSITFPLCCTLQICEFALLCPVPRMELREWGQEQLVGSEFVPGVGHWANPQLGQRFSSGLGE